MKKLSLVIAALALVIGISQCKKQEEPAANGQKQHIVLTADNGNDGSKVSADFVSANLNLTWDGNEVITVSGGATGTLGKITVDQSNPSKATFEGDIEITDESKLLEFTVGDTPNYEGQPGTEDGCEGWIKNNISLTGTDGYDPQGQYSANMKLPYAVLKLDVSALGSSGELKIKVGETLVASVTDVSAPKAVFVAVQTDGNEKEYKISIGGKTATKTWTLLPNVFYTKDDGHGAGTGNAIVIEPDAPATPKFSVSETTTVEFAPGNLQYIGSASTPYWRFAEHQWDYIGGTTGSGQGTDAEKVDRDLFGWGCTGFQDTRTSSTGYQTNYMPYSTSYAAVGSTDPAYNINRYGYGPDHDATNVYDLSVEHKSDWGCLAIGGDPAGTWRTLSDAEWVYLLNTRSGQLAPEIGSSTDCRYAEVKVNGVCGMMVFPDVFAWPSDVANKPSTFNTKSTTWNDVNYSATDFGKLESAGVVFLPAAGYRQGTNLYDVGSAGNYWSSTPFNINTNISTHAYRLYFFAGNVNPENKNTRYYGVSVRLVR